MTVNWDDFLTHSMTDEFMVKLRAKLVSENTHFLHKTHPEHLKEIAAKGLKPQRVFGAVMPNWVQIAGMNDQVLFVTPSRSSRPMNVSGETVGLAFAPEFLPARIGLDWTFPDFLLIAAYQFDRRSNPDPVRFAVDLMTEHSTILCYDGVPAYALRRWDRLAPAAEPLSWPALVG